MKFTKLSVLFALSFSCIGFSYANTFNNEISAGIADLNDVDDNFFGVGYRRYFEDVSLEQQAWQISPYLQRIDSVGIDYFSIDDNSRLQLNGEFFLDNDWIIRPRLGRIDLNNDDRLHRIGADLGQFIDDHWEVGAGIDYLKEDGDFSEDEDFLLSVYARYLSIDRNKTNFQPGWDLAVQGTVIGDQSILLLTGDYYFKRNWSVYAGIQHIDEDNVDADTSVNLGTNYWFNRSFSINFGLGADVGDGGLSSIDLQLKYRF